MIVSANCSNCRTNWKVEGAEAFERVDHETIRVLLTAFQVSCPTGICGGRLAPVTVIDMSHGVTTVISSPQDSAGNPLYRGDVVRYRGEERMIERVSVGKDSAGASLAKLEGVEEPASEWSIDLIRRGA